MVSSWHSLLLTWCFNMPSDWLQKFLLFHELVPAMQTPCVLGSSRISTKENIAVVLKCEIYAE